MSSSKSSSYHWIITVTTRCRGVIWSQSQYSSHSAEAILDLFRFPMERRPVEVEAAAERTVDWRSPAPCYRPTTSLPILHNRDRAQKGKVLWSWQIPLWKPSRFAIQRGGGDEMKLRDKIWWRTMLLGGNFFQHRSTLCNNPAISDTRL